MSDLHRNFFGAGHQANRLISYAASFGNTTLESLKKYQVADQVAQWLRAFDALSVRDENSRKNRTGTDRKRIRSVI